MDWADTPEQAAFREDVRSFIQGNLPEYYKRDRPDAGSEDDWQFDFRLGDD